MEKALQIKQEQSKKFEYIPFKAIEVPKNVLYPKVCSDKERHSAAPVLSSIETNQQKIA